MMECLSKINSMFKMSNSNRLIGRWCVNKCDKQETISVFWANSDHCGDNICGDPIKNKKILDEKLQNEKKKIAR